jgi:hypothetical protein
MKKRVYHGESKTPLYKVWQVMLDRCRNPKCCSWSKYGGRGIKVCARWQEFVTFKADVGDRSPGMTLERIDNNGDYEPGNVRWATYTEQNDNRRSTIWVEVAGVQISLARAVERIGGGKREYNKVHGRVRRGMDPKEALQYAFS